MWRGRRGSVGIAGSIVAGCLLWIWIAHISHNPPSRKAIAGHFCELNGKVENASGVPVLDARICATPISLATGSQTSCVSADANGRYMMRDLLHGDYRVSAWSESLGYGGIATPLALRVCPRPIIADIRIANRGERLAGFVRDSKGAAIRDANVKLIGADHTESFTLGANSDGHGAFEIFGPGGPAMLEVQASGFATVRIPVVAPNGDIEISMVRSSTLAGIVVAAATRNGVGDILVRAVPSNVVTQEAAPSVRSDASGHFEFKDLPPGDYRLAAESLSWRGEGRDLITLHLEERIDDLTIEVFPGAPVTARIVIDQSHAPCPSGHVVLTSVSPGDPSAISLSDVRQHWTSLIGADGIARFNGVPSHRYFAYIYCYGYRMSGPPPIVDVDESESPTREWTVERAPRVTIQVADATGRAIEAANVGLLSEENVYMPALHRGNGEFSILSVNPGNYRAVSTSGSGSSPTSTTPFTVAKDSDDLNVRLVLSGDSQIDIFAQHRDGSSRGGLQVYAISSLDEDAASEGSQRMVHGVELGGGRYRIAALSAAAYRVFVGDGRNPPMVQEVFLNPGETRALELQFDYEGHISGQIIDASGRPLARMLVSAHAVGALPSWPMGTLEKVALGRAVLSDALGRFDISGVADQSEYQVNVERGGAVIATRQRVFSGDHLEFAIQMPRSIHGTVVDANHRPIADFFLQATHDDTGTAKSVHIHDEQGRWSIDDWIPGRTTIVARDANRRLTTFELVMPEDQDIHGVNLLLKDPPQH